ncbi:MULTISPECIES: hypothetical protein [unclassified Nocardioides]|uniref:hypothetical protein n=1 Tax=unclassified Nocardioides TaxID=2615069 RepID=UPI0006F2E806|nr:MULTISPECIES: hypothetical protein [unclassified Nocardioides]KRA38348.1 hypothetical protein ASD81_06835 [Nocardioides sp. Root614]KRA92307.1 hypothetical protein ASD84_07100 [Nocardioides sp. Root682]
MYALTRSTAALLLSTAAAAATLAASPAVATSYNWYSASTPLTAWDGSPAVAQAYAYGTAYQKDGLLKNHTYYKDPRPTGQSVYTETSYSYFKWCSAGIDWCAEEGKDQSARDNSGSWVNQYDADDYSDEGADRGRVHVKVCEDQNNSPDACSRKPYFTFSI